LAAQGWRLSKELNIVVGRKKGSQREHENDKRRNNQSHQHFNPPKAISEVGSLCAIPRAGRDYINVADLLDAHESATPLKST